MSPTRVEIGRRVPPGWGLSIEPTNEIFVLDKPVEAHSTEKGVTVLKKGDLSVTVFSTSETPQGTVRVNVYKGEKIVDQPQFFQGKGPFYTEVRDKEGTEFVLRLERE